MTLLESLEKDVFDQKDYPKKLFNDLQVDETIDLLDNLGYVDFNQNGTENDRPGNNEVKAGIKKFRQEFSNSLVAQKLVLQQGKDLIFSEDELDVLADLSDIEGQFSLRNYSLMEIRQDNILCRVLHFRLSILALLKEPLKITSFFTENTTKALDTLGEYVGLSEKQLITLTDDFDKLIVKAAQRNNKGSFRNMAFFQFDPKAIKDLDLKTDTEKFEAEFQVLTTEDANYYDDFKSKKKKLTNKLEEHVFKVIGSSINEFYIRLVQIKLWLIGSYDGDLDGNMGEFSVKAFLDLYALAKEIEATDQDEIENEQEFVNPKKFLLELGKDNLWALNYKYLLLKGIKQFDKEFEDREKVKTISENLEKLISQAKESDQADIIKAVKEAIYFDHSRQVEENIKRRKRRKKKYRKGRGFFRSVGRFFKKVGEWIVTQVKRAIQAIKNFFKWLKNGILHLFREIKEAVARIIHGIKFFFSKRQIKTSDDNSNWLITDFDFDFDVRNDLHTEAAKVLVQKHVINIRSSTEDLGAALKFFEIAIPLIIQLASGPIGWIKAGIQLVKMLVSKKADNRILKFI